MKLTQALFCLAAAATAKAYELTGAGDISLTDVKTGISQIRTVFTDEPTLVTVNDLEWGEDMSTVTTLTYETFVDGKSQATGTIELDATEGLPGSIEAGEVFVKDRGTVNFRVEITSGDSTAESSADYQAFGNGVAIIPLLVVLGLAVTTRMVEFSLLTAIFVGACMVEGTITGGFKETLENYLLGAVADAGHAYVVLFSLFLSGLVGMMEKSGGMLGFTRDVARYATSSRSGQMCAFGVGVFVFFDDYANVLLAGETMRPLLDSLFVSREKLAFIVDATAAPVASISPVSSWVGFEIGLITDEVDRILAQDSVDPDTVRIKTSGMAIFLQSIKYRYYPIFMIVLMVALIYSKRDFGPMLVAERKTQVYKRTDGGDGKGKGSEVEGGKANQPEEDTPLKSWNMVVPVLLLVFFIFYLLIKTGESPGEDQTLMDKIEASDSYQALLWGTMAAIVCTMLMYTLQVVEGGDLLSPASWGQAIPAMFRAPATEGESQPRLLMNLNENMEAVLHGMGRIFPAIIVLNLAWAVGSLMVTVGADRLFARWILGISAEALPTISFIVSFFMALATGTSWGTMTILFPMVLLPTYNSSGGDPTIFYATTAGILSGSVAGDHVSPISDTTVLSALACDCNLLAHVSTQMGYAVIVSLVAILLGTVPIGYDAWPNIIGILIGAGLIVGFVYLFCAPVLSSTGRYDILTELILKIQTARGTEDSALLKLKEDTIKAYNGEYVDGEQEAKDAKLMSSDEESGGKDDTAAPAAEADPVEAEA
mmetsp:Transcript_3695/g.7364  ORF Transcript_3695/g.7364 Transcript_3695/m.7364 type:complete len:768 (-) Transcript_3695:90-2393(-)